MPARTHPASSAALRAALAAAVLLAAGCAADPGPAVLSVASGAYGSAFEAASDAARRNHMSPVLRDRRGGVIETDAVTAPSYFEPWAIDGSSPARRLEQTIAHERRRARFEFLPAGFDPPERPGGALIGADLFALEDEIPDLTAHDGPLELRVSVWVERASHRGIRRGLWTNARSRRAEEIGPDGEPMPATTWTPVARDEAFERRLLAEVESILESDVR